MTGDRLLFAVVSTVYLLSRCRSRKRGLQRQFGERYLEYRRDRAVASNPVYPLNSADIL